MKYFDCLTDEELNKIFHKKPKAINRDTTKDVLAYALGATLYMPATRNTIAEELIHNKYQYVKSIIICLEDAIGDKQVKEAEENIKIHLEKIQQAIDDEIILYEQLPLIFIRVRLPEQMIDLQYLCGETLKIINGFVFPKFTYYNGEKYFKSLYSVSRRIDKKLYGMPILESSDIIYKESRMSTLKEIEAVLNGYIESVLNIRIGVTDFSNNFGIRRRVDTTMYDIHIIRDCIIDIINFFGRKEKKYVISGSIWEYFSNSEERVFKPQLRSTPFRKQFGVSGIQIRSNLVDRYIDGLMYETLLDKVNGLIGKSIIHPSHILPVLAMHVITHEEYIDALSILENSDGQLGVMKSKYANKMNEVKPHMNWAKKVMVMADIYGVLNEDQEYASLLELCK